MAKNEFDITSLTPEQRDARLALDVERLLRFGRKHKLIKDLDILVARNTLLDLLALAAPSEAKPPKEDPETPAALLDEMVELAAQKELFDGAVNQYRINFETRLMGALMPRESEVCKKFRKLYVKQGAKAATDWFYQLCVDTNYIRTAQIAKNIQWNTATPYGELEITINLTKPEKDPKTIALERLQPKSGYPACMLCKENIGYAGRINFPARPFYEVHYVRIPARSALFCRAAGHAPARSGHAAAYHHAAFRGARSLHQGHRTGPVRLQQADVPGGPARARCGEARRR